MDGEPVEGGPSLFGVQDEQGIRRTFTELFAEAFPFYLSIGMSSEEFWRGNPYLARAFRKAWELKRRERNRELWYQGAYFYDALVKVAPYMRAAMSKAHIEPGKYMDRPFPLTDREAKQREEEARRQQFERMIQALDRESADNAKKRREAQETGPAKKAKKPRTGRKTAKEAGENANQH